jgi:hypothetical protein
MRTLLFFDMVIRFFIPLFLLVFSNLFVFAQQPTYSFQSKLSTDSILIGDQVELTITANVPKEYDVQFPFFADTIVTGIEVFGRPKIDTLIKRTGDKEFTYRINITSFDEGYYRIPNFKLPFSNGQTIDTAITSPIWLTVNTLPPDSTVATIFDINMPYSQPITFAEVAPWVGGGLLLAALIALIIIYFIKRKKGEPIFFPSKPAEPPHIIALRELQKIKDQKLWNTTNHKHYHSLLTDVIRFYIEGRYGVPAMEQTTFETIGNLRTKELLTAQLIEKLHDTLSLADLVKFARFKPEISENEASLNFGFRFVNETKVEVLTDVENGEQNREHDNTMNENTQKPVEPIKTNEL